MNKTVHDFIRDWNGSHPKDLNFSAEYIPGTTCPTTIEVRYPSAKFLSTPDFYSVANWKQFQDIVRAKAHQTVLVASNEDFFRAGIVSLAVASLDHKYKESSVVGVLKWICETFFTTD